jgi:hypothetical protein
MIWETNCQQEIYLKIIRSPKLSMRFEIIRIFNTAIFSIIILFYSEIIPFI